MFNLVITESGAYTVDGTPEFYIKDDDITKILNDKELSRALRKFFGRDVCIGRLGTLTNEVYNERHFSMQPIGHNSRDLCYYEAVKEEEVNATD